MSNGARRWRIKEIVQRWHVFVLIYTVVGNRFSDVVTNIIYEAMGRRPYSGHGGVLREYDGAIRGVLYGETWSRLFSDMVG